MKSKKIKQKFEETRQKFEEVISDLSNLYNEVKELKSLNQQPASGIEVHFDEVEKLPEKWCVKLTEENYKALDDEYVYPKGYHHSHQVSTNNWSKDKQDGYTEISFEAFKRLVLKEDEKPVELEVGKWYKSSDGVILNFNGKRDSDGDPRGYAVFQNKWFDDNSVGWSKTNWQPATDEEVKEALIKEAERRGFKDGVDYKAVGEHDGQTNTLDDSEWRHNVGNKKPSLCKLGLGRIFYDGKWAEIIHPEAIDFSKAGQLVKSENEVVLTTGWCNERVFNGVDVKDGEFRSDWLIDSFTLCTEPVTLSN